MSCIINVSFWKLYCWRCLSILPRSSTHKFQWWGSDRGSYFIPKKITTSEFVYPKKSLLFLPYPKKTLTPFFATQKYPSGFFCNPKKILASFMDPKKSLLAKIPPPPLSLKYVSGAPGVYSLWHRLQVWAWKWTRGKCCLSFIPLTWSSRDWCMSPDRSDTWSCTLYCVQVLLSHKNTQASTLVLKPYFHYRFLYYSMQPIYCFRCSFLKSLTMFSDFVLTAHWWIQENKPSKYCTKYCYRWTHIDRISTYSTYNLGSYSLSNPRKKFRPGISPGLKMS